MPFQCRHFGPHPVTTTYSSCEVSNSVAYDGFFLCCFILLYQTFIFNPIYFYYSTSVAIAVGADLFQMFTLFNITFYPWKLEICLKVFKRHRSQDSQAPFLSYISNEHATCCWISCNTLRLRHSFSCARKKISGFIDRVQEKGRPTLFEEDISIVLLFCVYICACVLFNMDINI